EGADVKIVLIHSGFGESSYDTTGVGPENDAAALASVNPKPDLVIVGHTHREIRDTVINGVHFVQPKNWAQSLSVVHVSLATATSAFDLQAGLPEGEAHQRDLSGIYPYENTLRAIRISGQQLREFLEHAALYFHTYQPNRSIINDSIAGYNFDVVSGVVYNIDLSRPPLQRIRGLAYEGRIVQPTDSFTMAVNSYRQAGGGGYSMLSNARV